MTKKTETAPPAAPATPAGPFLYLGPTLRTPALVQQNTIFSTLPPWVEADAAIAALCLPVEQAGKALQELKNGTSPLAHHVQTLLNKQKERQNV